MTEDDEPSLVASPAVSDPKRLASLHSYAVLDTPDDPAFDSIVAAAAMALHTPMALVSLIDGNRQWFKSELGMGVRETDLSRSICAKAIEHDGSFVVTDAMADPRVNGNPLVYGEPHIAFYAGEQLRDPEGRALGMLCVLDTTPRPDGITAEQADMLSALAAKVMQLLEAGKP